MSRASLAQTNHDESARVIVRERPKPWYKLDSAEAQIVLLWGILRIFTAIYLIIVSPIRPFTEPERNIAVWPPSAPFGAWLDRILLRPWERWDVKYYLWIVERGYRQDDGTAQFHPLLAWLATPFAWLTGNPLLALLLVSSLMGVLFLIAFGRLARLDLSPVATRTALLILLFSPPSWVLFAPYTEPLFLLCSVLCLLWARQQKWWLAGLAGALATLTRQQGLFLVLPLAWELWETANRSPRQVLRSWRDWLALGLIPAGLLVWLLYRAIALGDLQADFANPQAMIYSILISPSSSVVVPHQSFLPPWQALWHALNILVRTPNIGLIVDLTLGAAWMVLLAFAWRGMRTSYRIYTVVIALVSFGYYTGPFYPYMGLPRHLLLAFPVFISLGRVVRPGTRPLIFMSGILGMLFLLLLYALEAWTP